MNMISQGLKITKKTSRAQVALAPSCRSVPKEKAAVVQPPFQRSPGCRSGVVVLVFQVGFDLVHKHGLDGFLLGGEDDHDTVDLGDLDELGHVGIQPKDDK